MAKLEVRNLTISFRTNNGAVRAVRDISFNLNEGETLAIAGESGSGKSVTTRAVMGILAGNAMVDNGEIIYDGKDLLKIPEEEFHTLRGHKLSMVFQDPLSALNPIMRIGKQLTEAMILNNQERRADGKARFNSINKALYVKMIAEELEKLEKDAQGTDETDAAALKKERKLGQKKAAYEAKRQVERNVKDKIDIYKAFTFSCAKIDNAYNEAKEACIELDDYLDEIKDKMQKNEFEAGIKKLSNRLSKAIAGINSKYLKPPFSLLDTGAMTVAQNFKFGSIEEMKAQVDEIRVCLEKANVSNEEAKNLLISEFMSGFLKDMAETLAYSDRKSRGDKRKAIEELEAAISVFEEEKLNEARCKAACKRAAKAVNYAIDPLALEKDNLAYVFESSMKGYIERYFRALKHNPKEEKRFARDTKSFEKAAAKGKIVASVVPMNLIDGEMAKKNMVNTIRTLIDHFQQQLQETKDKPYDKLAVELNEYIKARAQDYTFRLTQGMARHGAIELMREVGIPDPYKRYKQYPFEFSGGMRQRIVIAIALSANPDILICDEPTTALDVTIQAQILELINKLKKERNLSVIFITHDLGVVANMADKIAIMYAGKIVEYGTADDVFYDPRHPYTWALLSSMPDLDTKEKLEAIPGTPPDMILPPTGDAFAARNKYAMRIDFEEQPPMFKVSDTHSAATWLLHPDAPKVEPPEIVTERIHRMKKLQGLAENNRGGANV